MSVEYLRVICGGHSDLVRIANGISVSVGVGRVVVVVVVRVFVGLGRVLEVRAVSGEGGWWERVVAGL